MNLALDPGIGSRLYNRRVNHQNGKSGFLRIGELARAAGVSADTLRHYERKGLLKPLRQSNGYREYPQHAADRVRMIRHALALGFRLDDLARLKAEIKYKFEEMERGGRVRLSTTNAEAIKAIHEFLRFQIEDHKTGDSKEVK